MKAKSDTGQSLIPSDLIDQMVQRIVDAVAPERIILFGSYALGTAGPDSDVDLLVIEREPFSPDRSRRKELLRLIRALRNFPVSKDILLFSREEYEQWCHARNHVIAHATREGKTLYEQS